MPSTSQPPKVSIGLPVYNGEKFIQQRLENILDQSFSDFEVIISDNASTDSTSEICRKYKKKDIRIEFHRQKKNLGMFSNFNFVLNQARGKYFVIANVDDLWKKNFLEKNVNILESHHNIVVSMGKIQRYGLTIDEFKPNLSDGFFKRGYKWFRRQFRPFNIYPVSGTFEDKISFCLRNFNFWGEFGVFRRNELQKSVPKKSFYGWDWAYLINSLRYGDVYVINEDLMSFHTGGTSSKGIIGFLRSQKISLFRLFFPFGSFTSLCINQMGLKFFLKNFDYFVWLNFIGIISILLEVRKLIKQ